MTYEMRLSFHCPRCGNTWEVAERSLVDWLVDTVDIRKWDENDEWPKAGPLADCNFLEYLSKMPRGGGYVKDAEPPAISQSAEDSKSTDSPWAEWFFKCNFCGQTKAFDDMLMAGGDYADYKHWFDVNVSLDLATDEGTGLPRGLCLGDRWLDVLDVVNASQANPTRALLSPDAEGGTLVYELGVRDGTLLVKRTASRATDGGAYRWVLKGVSSRELYDTLLRPGNEPPPQAVMLTSLQPPLTIAMDAFALIFKLETKTRWCIYYTLKKEFSERYDEAWWDSEKFWLDRGEMKGIEEAQAAFQKATKMKVREPQNPLLGKLPEAHVFCYLLLTDLTTLLEVFDKLFFGRLEQERAGTRDGVIGALRTVELYRNMVAHNRPFTRQNVMSMRDSVNVVLRAIELLENRP